MATILIVIKGKGGGINKYIKEKPKKKSMHQISHIINVLTGYTLSYTPGIPGM